VSISLLSGSFQAGAGCTCRPGLLLMSSIRNAVEVELFGGGVEPERSKTSGVECFRRRLVVFWSLMKLDDICGSAFGLREQGLQA
jgi:hypothetical protein